MAETCQLCGNNAWRTVSTVDRHGKPLTTLLCEGCGIVVNDPIPSDEQLAAFYRTDYRTEYKGAATPRRRQVWRNFRRIEAHIRANREVFRSGLRCLDLGSGSGEFMFIASALGLRCTGVEPNRPYAEYSRTVLGLDVKSQTIEETAFADGSFDHIRLSHVLEHMRMPVRSLETLHRWLADDGILYIEVPNIESEAAHKVRGTMFHFGHIFNFNPVTLRLAAGLAGFEELPGTRQRDAQSTGAFFRKAGKPTVPGDLRANAQRMGAAMDAHNARLLPRPPDGNAVKRMFGSWAMRLGPSVASLAYSGPRSIADHFARRIAR